MPATTHPTTTTSPEGAPAAPPVPEIVPVDLFRDIHKGIRAELFRVTLRAGNTDPADAEARTAVAGDVRSLFALLAAHAAHEDERVQTSVTTHAPKVASVILDDHAVLEQRMVQIQGAADAAADSPAAEARARAHGLYLDLASFTSAYLAHQDFEEREVMPALAAAMTVPEILEVHTSIVSNIPPDEMAESLAIMLPALNVDDRAELLGGMQQGAPPEVFAGIWALAGTVLDPAQHDQLGRRLGLT